MTAYLIFTMLLKFIFSVIILFCFNSLTVGQNQQVVVDAANNEPIEYVNVLVPKLRKGVFSNHNGNIYFNDAKITLDDTVLITHVSYQPLYFSYKNFLELDTIRMIRNSASLEEVVIKPLVNLDDYINTVHLGYFNTKYTVGGLYMRVGEQIGLRIVNKDNLHGVLTEVKLHFEKLIPNASFRVRFKKINEDKSIGDELLQGGVIIKPKKLKQIINLSEYKILLPKYGIFVFLDFLGDGKIYANRMSSPYIVYACTTNFNEYNTFNNFMDAYKWNKWNHIIRNEKNPSNVQIQIKVLHK